MSLLDQIWTDLINVGRMIMKVVEGIFKTAGGALRSAFDWIVGAVKDSINWTWKGFDAIVNGVSSGISALGKTVLSGWHWFVQQLRVLWNVLINTMNELFKVTEGLIMKYARWQASAQLRLEREILNGWE